MRPSAPSSTIADEYRGRRRLETTVHPRDDRVEPREQGGGGEEVGKQVDAAARAARFGAGIRHGMTSGAGGGERMIYVPAATISRTAATWPDTYLARLRLGPTRHARRPFPARACRAPATRRSFVPSRRKPPSEAWLDCEDRGRSRHPARRCALTSRIHGHPVTHAWHPATRSAGRVLHHARMLGESDAQAALAGALSGRSGSSSCTDSRPFGTPIRAATPPSRSVPGFPAR